MRRNPRSTALPPRPPMASEAEVNAVLAAGLGAIKRGEEVGPAIAAEQARFNPPGPTLDDRAVARLNGNGWTAERQRAFLVHLAATGSVSHACRHVGLSRQGAYELRDRYPTSVFAILWKVAHAMGRRRLFDEALERAVHGREEAVWYGGEQVGTRIVHNDRLLMFLMAQRPEAPHPNMSQEELEELWPALLPSVDAVLPPTLTTQRLADLSGGGDRRS